MNLFEFDWMIDEIWWKGSLYRTKEKESEIMVRWIFDSTTDVKFGRMNGLYDGDQWTILGTTNIGW